MYNFKVKNSRSNIVIVGNGFDLHHNMKTQFKDYREYLLENGFGEIVNAFEKDRIDFDDQDGKIRLWNELELELGLLPYESAEEYLLPYSQKPWSDDYHHAFQREVEEYARYWPGIKMHLREWINSVEYTKPDEGLKEIIYNAEYYISFNYTNTLERLYRVDKNKICYIHGDASIDEELIIGHRDTSYYPEWDDKNPDEDPRLLQAGEFMKDFLKATYKDTEQITKNSAMFKAIAERAEISNIFVLGHSCSDIDIEYFRMLSDCKRWFFSYHTEDDKKNIDKLCDIIGIVNHSVFEL